MNVFGAYLTEVHLDLLRRARLVQTKTSLCLSCADTLAGSEGLAKPEAAVLAVRAGELRSDPGHTAAGHDGLRLLGQSCSKPPADVLGIGLMAQVGLLVQLRQGAPVEQHGLQCVAAQHQGGEEGGGGEAAPPPPSAAQLFLQQVRGGAAATLAPRGAVAPGHLQQRCARALPLSPVSLRPILGKHVRSGWCLQRTDHGLEACRFIL